MLVYIYLRPNKKLCVYGFMPKSNQGRSGNRKHTFFFRPKFDDESWAPPPKNVVPMISPPQNRYGRIFFWCLLSLNLGILVLFVIHCI
jgi:hypothetical protein